MMRRSRPIIIKTTTTKKLKRSQNDNSHRSLGEEEMYRYAFLIKLLNSSLLFIWGI